MPREAIEDWLSLLEDKANQRGVPINFDVEGRIFHFKIGAVEPVLGKVRISQATSRNFTNERGETHIWQRFDREQEKLKENPNRRVCSVQLDIKGSGGYDDERDHFLFIPGEMILQETYSQGDQKIYITGDGQYRGELARYDDDWEALFEYAEQDLSLDQIDENQVQAKLSELADDPVNKNEETISTKEKPAVWIEKTQVAGREYKQEGEYKLGNTLMSPSRDEGGRKRYEAMREAEVGDIVLHLLQDQHQFAGVSIIDSDLNEDFEGPPTDRWTDEQQEQGGYLRWLRDYERIEPHIHVYDDLLEHSEYEDELQEIRENSGKIFYDKRLSLNQGHYFTRCPDELAEILANESRHLRELLEKRGYQFETRPESIPPANEYSGTENESKIEEATNDIRSRLERREDSQGWPIEGVAKGIIQDWTDTLRRSNIVAEEISSTDRVKCEQIVSLYEEHASEFDQLAEHIQSGTIEDSRLSPGQVLYIALFRELQDLAGERPNMNQVKFEKLLQGAHRGESGESLTPPNEPPAGIEIDRIERQLNKTGQLVFYGPPGTGKTYTAQRFARWWLNEQDEHTPSESQLETVTFHPSFSYEDFIEGLTAEEKDGEVAYEIKDGVFKKISQRAKQAYEHSRDSNEIEEIPRYVLIIDEINRGNLAQIFGETMTLLESDKRYDQENEVKISLAHSGDSFVVPPNLYVIGTMNTADRSIALVDAALRRRFRFISFPPNYKVVINDYDIYDNLDEVRTVAETDPDPYRSLVALSILALRGLNERIVDAPDLGKGKQIGHSYLMNLDNVDDVLDAWKYEILPLIEEYYFGQFARIREELFDGIGDRLFQWEQEEIADFTADELRRTLAGLEEISLAEPETEASEDTQYTIELLLNEGVIEAGTQLVFDESKVPDYADRAYDSSELFWRCEITGKTGQSDNVQWLHNDEQYSFSGLAQTILERISDHSEPVTGPDYWQHPEFEDRLLADLRTDVQSGKLVVDEQTTDQ